MQNKKTCSGTENSRMFCDVRWVWRACTACARRPPPLSLMTVPGGSLGNSTHSRSLCVQRALRAYKVSGRECAHNRLVLPRSMLPHRGRMRERAEAVL